MNFFRSLFGFNPPPPPAVIAGPTIEGSAPSLAPLLAHEIAAGESPLSTEAEKRAHFVARVRAEQAKLRVTIAQGAPVAAPATSDSAAAKDKRIAELEAKVTALQKDIEEAEQWAVGVLTGEIAVPVAPPKAAAQPIAEHFKSEPRAMIEQHFKQTPEEAERETRAGALVGYWRERGYDPCPA